MKPDPSLPDSLVDTAAGEALGANTPEESAAYQRQIDADPTGAARRLDRELRHTAARLAAASPYMKPPADLRGRILQATAPVTFKMEDYRRATREDYRFYKWGFYAAAVFLIMGALYNIDTRGKLDQANKNVVALRQQEQQIAARSNEIITTFARGDQITWRDETGKPYGKAIVDMTTHKAVMIFPQETMPGNLRPQLNLTLNDQKIAFDTTLITASASELNFAVPKNAPDIATLMNPPTVKPDNTIKPMTADFSGSH
jgi:hypothetical protein